MIVLRNPSYDVILPLHTAIVTYMGNCYQRLVRIAESMHIELTYRYVHISSTDEYRCYDCWVRSTPFGL
jgi:hypothetical protein